MLDRTFGPAVRIDREANTVQAECTWCSFRISDTCTWQQSNPRHIPDIKDTPDFCEMKADMLRDAQSAAAKEPPADLPEGDYEH